MALMSDFNLECSAAKVAYLNRRERARARGLVSDRADVARMGD